MASTVYDPEICIGAFSMLISDPAAKNNVKMTRMLVLSPVTLCYITNWKPRIATVHSCFDLVGSRQHGVASNEVISWSTDHPHPLNTDGDDLRQIETYSNAFFCRLANVTYKTRDKGQQEKSRISCLRRDIKIKGNRPQTKIGTNTVPQKTFKSCPNHVKM